MRRIFLALILFLFAFPLFAQDNFVGVGGVINSNNTGNFQFSGVLEKVLSKSMNLYGLTFADVSGITLKPLSVTHLQYTGSQAIVVYFPVNGWLKLGILGEAGLTGTVDVTTGRNLGTGGVADIDCGKKIHLKFIPKFVNNTVSGNQFEFRIYPGVSF